MPTVSIIICTRNRAESLRPTLASIGRAEVPAGWQAELMVVDNGSTDDTAEVVRDARLGNMTVRYLSEPWGGLSFARNTGLRETSGEIILFTDDDVRVPEHWIEGMGREIFNGHADAVAGGVVFPPLLDFAVNSCRFRTRRGWLASTEEIDPQRPKRLVGANMAFHRRVLERVPGFDVELGAGALGFGEETLFSWRLLAAGYRLAGALDTAVEHHFDLKRLTEEGLVESALKMARSHAFIVYHWEHRRLWLALPRLILCHLRRYGARFSEWIRKSADTGISSLALRLEADLAFHHECLVQRRRSHKYPLCGGISSSAQPEAESEAGARRGQLALPL
jgi:glycosyltransferase involved in cell wall biosynthesis